MPYLCPFFNCRTKADTPEEIDEHVTNGHKPDLDEFDDPSLLEPVFVAD